MGVTQHGGTVGVSMAEGLGQSMTEQWVSHSMVEQWVSAWLKVWVRA